MELPPISNRSIVDFGKPLGRRETFVYNLPEVRIAAKAPAAQAFAFYALLALGRCAAHRLLLKGPQPHSRHACISALSMRRRDASIAPSQALKAKTR